MSWSSDPRFLWLLLLWSIVLILIVIRLFRKQPGNFPYEKQPALFTPAERLFLKALEQAVDDRYLIFGKVRLADIIRVQRGLDTGLYRKAFNKISAKHLDFIICDGKSLVVIGAIELDDATHLQAHRRLRDEFVNAALAAAGVPILHIPVRKRYPLPQLKQQLAGVLNIR